MRPSREWVEQRVARAREAIVVLAAVGRGLLDNRRRTGVLELLVGRRGGSLSDELGPINVPASLHDIATTFTLDAEPFAAVSSGMVPAGDGDWALSYFDLVGMLLVDVASEASRLLPSESVAEMAQRIVAVIERTPLLQVLRGVQLEGMRLAAQSVESNSGADGGQESAPTTDEAMPILEAAVRIVVPRGYTQKQAHNLVRNAVRRTKDPIPVVTLRGRSCVRPSDVIKELRLRALHGVPGTTISHQEGPSTGHDGDTRQPEA